jgi:hypothetical protein
MGQTANPLQSHHPPTEPRDTGFVHWRHLGDAPRCPPSHAHPLCVGPYTLYGVACAPGMMAAAARLPAFWWVLLLRDENPRFVWIPDGSQIRIPKQAVYLSFFFRFGDSTPINQNSKLYAGRRRTYDRRQGEIQARKRYEQENEMKGNCTFTVRLCVTTGRRLWIQTNPPPRFPSTLGPCSRDREQQSPEPQKGRTRRGGGRKQSSEQK